jgi:hypothetical protein
MKTRDSKAAAKKYHGQKFRKLICMNYLDGGNRGMENMPFLCYL